MPNKMMLTLQERRKLAYGQCITLKSAPKIKELKKKLPIAKTIRPFLKRSTIKTGMKPKQKSDMPAMNTKAAP